MKGELSRVLKRSGGEGGCDNFDDLVENRL